MPKSLKEILGSVKPKPKRTGPLWTGPNGDGDNGGVTQGLLGRFLSCRERFRVLVIDGLKPGDRFSAPIEFGQMWHTCEEALAAKRDWSLPLDLYASTLCQRFPLDRQEIEGWYQKCKALFPRYVNHWDNHPDVKNRKPLLQEQKFDVPYKLPSGRTVRLRGKWDSVDLIENRIWIQENKTKSAIDAQKISLQVTFDLQTLMYLIALQEATKGGKILR